MSADAPDDVEREFDVLMARSGIRVPDERRAGSIAVYRDLRRMAALLREPRPAESEPAIVFSLEAFLRAD